MGAGSFVAGREETLGRFGGARGTSYGSSEEGNAGLVTDSILFCWLFTGLRIGVKKVCVYTRNQLD